MGRRVAGSPFDADPGTPASRGAARTSRRNENTGNWGLSAHWSPEWLDGTLGFYYRRTYDMLPQGDGDAGVSAGSGSSVYAARRSRRCRAAFASSTRRPRRCRSCSSSARSARTTRLRRRHRHLRRQPGEEHRRRELRRRTELSPQHAAGERTGVRAARRVRAAGAGVDRDDRCCPKAARRARWATRCTAWSTRSASSPRRRVFDTAAWTPS